MTVCLISRFRKPRKQGQKPLRSKWSNEELELVVPDDKVEKVLETIRKVAATDQGADGRIHINTG